MTPEIISIHRRKASGLLFASSPRLVVRRPPSPEHPLIISASELRDFLRCRVKWNWRHQARLEPVERPEALAIGTVVSVIQHAWYALPLARRTRKTMAKIAKRVTRDTTIEALSTEDRELVVAMCVGYAAWAKAEDAEIGLKEAFPEDWFDLPLTEDGSIRVRGRIDIRFEPQRRVMGFTETKAKSQIRVDMVDMNIQLSVYFWAIRMKYPKVREIRGYYQILRKQMPGPRVRAELFHREAFERTPEEVDQWVVDTRRAALDMLDAAIYPSPMDSCGWDCDFQVPCLLRGRPDDLQHVLETQYKIKQRRN
jgi:hypothetical protein